MTRQKHHEILIFLLITWLRVNGSFLPKGWVSEGTKHDLLVCAKSLSVTFKIHPWASTNHYLPLNHLSFMCSLRCHGMELIRQKRSLFWHDKNIMKFLLPSSHNLIKSQWICLLWRRGEGGHQTELTGGVCNNFLCIYECNWIKSYFSLVL